MIFHQDMTKSTIIRQLEHFKITALDLTITNLILLYSEYHGAKSAADDDISSRYDRIRQFRTQKTVLDLTITNREFIFQTLQENRIPRIPW